MDFQNIFKQDWHILLVIAAVICVFGLIAALFVHGIFTVIFLVIKNIIPISVLGVAAYALYKWKHG